MPIYWLDLLKGRRSKGKCKKPKIVGGGIQGQPSCIPVKKRDRKKITTGGETNLLKKGGKTKMG